jgi:hypothetical protein
LMRMSLGWMSDGFAIGCVRLKQSKKTRIIVGEFIVWSSRIA